MKPVMHLTGLVFALALSLVLWGIIGLTLWALLG
jgi:hypothetical protein